MRDSLFCEKRGEVDRRKGLELVGRKLSGGLVSPSVRIFGLTGRSGRGGNCKRGESWSVTIASESLELQKG